MNDLRQLEDHDVDAVSGGTDRYLYNIGVTMALGGIAAGGTGVGVAVGFAGLAVMIIAMNS